MLRRRWINCFRWCILELRTRTEQDHNSFQVLQGIQAERRCCLSSEINNTTKPTRTPSKRFMSSKLPSLTVISWATNSFEAYIMALAFLNMNMKSLSFKLYEVWFHCLAPKSLCLGWKDLRGREKLMPPASLHFFFWDVCNIYKHIKARTLVLCPCNKQAKNTYKQHPPRDTMTAGVRERDWQETLGKQ